MNIHNIKECVYKWAATKTFIKSVHIFGSRAREDYRENSDIDIAVELIPNIDECNGFSIWCRKHEKWQREIEKLLPYRVQLEWNETEGSGIVQLGLQRSSILVYLKQ